MGIGPGNVQYNYAQLQSIWIQAGGNATQAPLAAAVAMAESGGNSTAFNQDSNGSIDRGLWQINSVHGAASSYDVMTNARAAVQISCNGNCTNSCSLSGFTGWGNWTTYCSGEYRQFMQGGVTPQPAPTNGTQAAQNNTTPPANADLTACSTWQWILSPGACAASGAVSGAEGIAGNIVKGLVGSILNPIIEIISGVMGMAGGAIIMVFGVYLIVKESQTAQQVGQGVKSGIGFASWFAGPEAGMATNAAEASSAQGARQARPRPQQQRPQQTQRQQEQATQNELRQESYRYPNAITTTSRDV